MLRPAGRVTTCALLLTALVLLARCASPTEMQVDIFSEVPCSKNAEVGLAIGAGLADLETRPASSTSLACDPATGRVGRVVIVPSGDRTADVAFRVVTRDDDLGPDACTADGGYRGCIVARRELRFTPHTALGLRVDLRLSCLDVPCAPTETCVRGSCVSPAVPPGCATSPLCGEGALAPGNHCTPPEPATALAPRVIAPAGSVIAPTGLAQQTHLVFAQNDCRYWYFYEDDDRSVLKARASSDLVNWTDGGALPLPGPHGGNAGDFSVAYAEGNGVDTIHVVIDIPGSMTGVSYHLRTTLTGSPGGQRLSAPVATPLFPSGFGTPSPSGCEPDGPSVVVGPDGHVYDATGWWYDPRRQTLCDLDVFRSDIVETGGNWNPTFAHTGYYVTTSQTTAHQLVALPEAGLVFGAYAEPSASASPFYDGVAWARDVTGWDGGAGQAPVQLFPDQPAMATAGDDWALCRLADDDVYAVRHVVPSLGAAPDAFEVVHFDGVGWSAQPSVPAPLMSARANAGLVLLSDTVPSHGMLAVVLGSDGSSLSYTHFNSAAAGGAGGWSATWSSFSGAAPRSWLAGSGCGSTRPLLFWTESTGAGSSQIVGVDVSSLLE